MAKSSGRHGIGDIWYSETFRCFWQSAVNERKGEEVSGCSGRIPAHCCKGAAEILSNIIDKCLLSTGAEPVLAPRGEGHLEI